MTLAGMWLWGSQLGIQNKGYKVALKEWMPLNLPLQWACLSVYSDVIHMIPLPKFKIQISPVVLSPVYKNLWKKRQTIHEMQMSIWPKSCLAPAVCVMVFIETCWFDKIIHVYIPRSAWPDYLCTPGQAPSSASGNSRFLGLPSVREANGVSLARGELGRLAISQGAILQTSF